MPIEQTRYSRLANLTKLINTKLELHDVLKHVVTAISEEIISCDSVGIYLPQDDGTFKGFVGRPEVINGQTLDKHIFDPKIDLLANEVIETRETIYIPNTSSDHRPDRRAVEAFQIKSLLVLPISYEDELFGLVYMFDSGTPMNLTEAEIQTVEAYVNMAAVAIQNSTNLTRKEKLIAEKQLLLDVTRDLSMSSSVQEAMDRSFYYMSQVLKNTNIGVHLLDPTADNKILPARLYKESDWTEVDWLEVHEKVQIDHTKDSVFQEVIQTKMALIIPDVFADPRPNHEACRIFGLKGMYIIPLVAMGEVLGVVPVASFEEGFTYSEAQMQLTQSIVDATAATVYSLLYMEKQELLITERTSEISAKNSELENVVRELQRLSHEKELILNSAGEGIFGLNLEGNITFCNPAGAEMLGYMKDELIGKPYSEFFNRKKLRGDDIATYYSFYMENKTTTYFAEEYFFRKDSSRFPVEYVITSIKEEENIIGYVVTFKDVTARKEMEEKINYHANYDSLTSLPNRMLLKDRLNQGLTYAQLLEERLAVILLDLDRFKMINETFGHNYGDLLLQEVAERLSTCVSKGATISRQGGDEFTIIIPNVKDKNQVTEIAESIKDSFITPFILNGNEIYIKTSIGISMFPKDGDNAEVLIKNADTAMYKSKEMSGDNYQFFAIGMNDRIIESVKLENGLHRAIERDELVIYYQPQIDYLSNKIIGAEALLRWNHPTEGMISPVNFIPIAEETGLIVPIGEWVLRKACQQTKEWHDQGFSFMSVSVNLSVRQFEQQNLVCTVDKILRETNLPPEFLELELTENIIIKDTKAIVNTMQQLKNLGIGISIDDFGTGYSSLGYLKNFPINTLKIDKSFVDDITKDTNNAAITNTIITLGQNLQLNVIAEGVATKEQIDFLISNGCNLMQGYYFSPPIRAEDLYNKYLKNNQSGVY